MRILTGVVLALATAGTASAQSPYVGASFVGEIVRVSGSRSGAESGNGETFGAALRAGVPLGSQWGVELEFVRTGEVEASPGVFLAGGSFAFESIGDSIISPTIFPSPRISSERQLSTISTLVWWNHDVSDRISLAYLGGVAFTRVDLDIEIEYDFPVPLPVPGGGVPLPLPRPLPINVRSESVSYGADVVVGFEGRVGMTDHLRLVPGIRMQTAVGGWAIRPGVGLQWAF
jgi:hypothetical protein